VKDTEYKDGLSFAAYFNRHNKRSMNEPVLERILVGGKIENVDPSKSHAVYIRHRSLKLLKDYTPNWLIFGDAYSIAALTESSYLSTCDRVVN
jgi:hypothetical protein